jgi:Lon protease-like protein
VLFPNVFLPLHIFEPRYRDMMADVLAADRVIGMVLLKPGWEPLYDGRPPIYPIGCSGVISHVERMADGCYNIAWRGLERFRVLAEDHARSYRRARVEPVLEPELAADDRAALRHQRVKLEALLGPVIERANAARRDQRPGRAAKAIDPAIPASMADEDLVNALAQYLDLEPLEKLALLEQRNLRTRAEALVELIEMKILIARTPGVSQAAH